MIYATGRVKLIAVVLSSFVLLLVTQSMLNCNAKHSMEKRGSVKGILKNAAGRVVEDAIVMIKDGDHSFNDIASVSNEKGEFYVSGIVIPGNYTLQVDYNGNSFTRLVNIQTADTVLMINF